MRGGEIEGGGGCGGKNEDARERPGGGTGGGPAGGGRAGGTMDMRIFVELIVMLSLLSCSRLEERGNGAIVAVMVGELLAELDRRLVSRVNMAEPIDVPPSSVDD